MRRLGLHAIVAALVACALVLSGCAFLDKFLPGSAEEKTTAEESVEYGPIDMTQWHYDKSAGVYWQSRVPYCETPADAKYETMSIYVPEKYFSAKANKDDDTYTCAVNEKSSVKGYTAATAPVIFPVYTPNYNAHIAPKDYTKSAKPYTKAGFIYVVAGCRGVDSGAQAPAAVADLKAALRYLRSNASNLPGDTENIFAFGLGGGAAQAALLGASGDAEEYEPYLDALGAVADESDAIKGCASWCPITSFDYADAAYEWNLGATRTDLDDGSQLISSMLAEEFAKHLNSLKLQDDDGVVMQLNATQSGIYQNGTYYDHLKTVVEDALNAFLAETEFPYTVEASEASVSEGSSSDGGDSSSTATFGSDVVIDSETLRGSVLTALDMSGTYKSAQKYVDALNADVEWVTYDKKTNTAAITSVTDFVKALKPANRSLGAYDDLDTTNEIENTLFGTGGETGHFDAVLGELLDGIDYGDAIAEDLDAEDEQGTKVEQRVEMYSPLYYLSSAYDGYGKSTAAGFWRIRAGVEQSDAPLTTETNLALALSNYGADVNFAEVWGQGYGWAEVSGKYKKNFITWVNDCMMTEEATAEQFAENVATSTDAEVGDAAASTK